MLFYVICIRLDACSDSERSVVGFLDPGYEFAIDFRPGGELHPVRTHTSKRA
jgi:hypothetical protein